MNQVNIDHIAINYENRTKTFLKHPFGYLKFHQKSNL